MPEPPAPAADLGPSAIFDWPAAPAAEKFLRHAIAAFLKQNSFARQLARRMQLESGTDFLAWVDHIVLPAREENKLRALGFVTDEAETPTPALVLKHLVAVLPRVILAENLKQNPAVIALHVESIADFVAAHALAGKIEGAQHARFRSVLASEEKGTKLIAVERTAYTGFVPSPVHFADLKKIVYVRELWQTRPRQQGFVGANRLLDESIDLTGKDATCQFFFAAERRYWEGRNSAARLQKHRQDVLGLGWANHDHHALRSSRECFVDLIAFLMRLGFQKRERIYAGSKAGWGAQVLEQIRTGVVVYAEVDLSPEEATGDFSTTRLKAGKKLGVIGTWCKAHGESLFGGGLHHLAVRGDFATAVKQLPKNGIKLLRPSSGKLLRAALTKEEDGRHLEILQRLGGFKGF